MSERVTYAFHYRSLDNTATDEFAINDVANRELTYDSFITWDVVLRDFITFLSGVYGYDIGDQVKFETFDERMDRIREKNGFSSDWPYEEDYDDKGEEATQV